MIELFGKTIQKIYMDSEKNYIVFCGWTQQDVWPYRVTGGCCSSSQFDDLLDFQVLIGNEIIGIEKRLYEDTHSTSETIKTYGYMLKTIKGQAEIVFRNTSNGYYDGDMEYLSDAFLVDELPNSNDLEINAYPAKKNIRSNSVIVKVKRLK